MSRKINWERVFEDKFNHLLVALIAIFAALPFMNVFQPRFPIISLVYLAFLLVVLKSFIQKASTFGLYLLVAGAAFLIDLLERSGIAPGINVELLVIGLMLHSLFLTMVIVLLSKELFFTKEVTGDAIKGGICIYILVGMLWAFLYSSIAVIDPQAFNIPVTLGSEMFYFSFTTLTTLGYGDITPVNAYAKFLTSLESVGGQMFLTIFVARLVGLYIVQDIQERRHELHGMTAHSSKQRSTD